MDVFEEARGRICPELVHTYFQCTGSYTEHGEYYILSPLRQDHKVGSFHINENNGTWYDHATKEGGDFIHLVALYKGIADIEAAKEISCKNEKIFIRAAKTEKEIEKLPDPLVPIPQTDELKNSIAGTVSYDLYKKLWGIPSHVYRYFNHNKEWLFFVCRYEKIDGDKTHKRTKNDIAFYRTVDGKWKAKRHPSFEPYEPYGVENIADTVLPILIVEGEKCKEAAQKKLAGKYAVLSWLGGTSNVQKTDWGKLRELLNGQNRPVILWPDADSQRDKTGIMIRKEEQPGMKAMLYIKAYIPEAKILEIYRAFPIEAEPKGYDIADYISDGKDPSQFIADYMPYKSIDVRVDPYDVYRSFIDNHYEHDNLVQYGGWFWEYSPVKHYFSRLEKQDIKCNFQRWLEETGVQWIISKKTEATKFIGKVMQYVDRHSVGYIKDNPFRDAAISPYVHFTNGAVKFSKEGTEWMGRDKYTENNFRLQYPLACLDVNVNYENYKNIIPQNDFPAFYFYVKEMIPKTYMASLDQEEKEKCINDTLVYFSEILAYTISPIKQNEYIFGLYGNERTGKSFFISIIKKLIGADFCSERRIDDMENRFAVSGLWGKKVYIEPDLKTRSPLPEDFIKSYAGETVTTMEAKNKDPIDGVKMSLAMFFVSNYEFQVHGTEGITRRLVLIPFKNNIKVHDTRLLDKICGEFPHGIESGGMDGEIFDERPGLISLALQGWDRYRADGFIITPPEWVKSIKNDWEINANSTLKFLQDTFVIPNYTAMITVSDTYEKYVSWCGNESRKPLGKKNFIEEVRKENIVHEFKAGDGKYYFRKEIDNTQPSLIKNNEEIPF